MSARPSLVCVISTPRYRFPLDSKTRNSVSKSWTRRGRNERYNCITTITYNIMEATIIIMDGNRLSSILF